MPAITTALLGIAATGGSMYMAKRSGDRAKKEAKAAEQQMAAQTAALAERESKDRLKGFADDARRRQRAMVAGAFGKADTIKTGPLGLSSPAPTIKNRLGE